jgi:hypothetical protein
LPNATATDYKARFLVLLKSLEVILPFTKLSFNLYRRLSFNIFRKEIKMKEDKILSAATLAMG